LGWNPNIFGYLGAHAKFKNPKTTPSERISNEPEEERERRRRGKNAIYSGLPRAVHARRSDQLLFMLKSTSATTSILWLEWLAFSFEFLEL
jgi:hypothetical protein